jgi:hypothetical protein
VIKEALAMRRLLFFLPIILVGCGSDGIDTEVMLTPDQHVPELSNLTLSPNDALYMEGGGGVQVTAEIAFTDLKGDLQTLHIQISDEMSLMIPISTSVKTVSGTLTETFDVTTTNTDERAIEVWVVDRAGQSSNHLNAMFSVIKHTPEILSVNLSPDSATYMEGDGSLVVSAEVMFMDAGRDIQALRVRMPDGTTVEFDEIAAVETGAITADFPMSTEKYGEFTVTFQLIDKTGIYSTPSEAGFGVIWNGQASEWTNRLGGLPYVPVDVIWDGDTFIAVGGGGSILTSADGIDWTARESGTEADLRAVATYGPDILAVGDEIVLLSTDHGETWITKNEPVGIALSTVTMNSSRVVVGGWDWSAIWESRIMTSDDRGDTWQDIGSLPVDFVFLTDSMYRDELFIATADSPLTIGPGWIFVSTDGEIWNEIFRDLDFGLDAVVHAGSQFIVAGRGGTVISSIDGLNWAKAQTPVEGVDYLSAAWNGSKVVLAGGYSCWKIHFCNPPEFDLPVGLSSTDGGASWEAFNIDGQYHSLGLAFGNGRFVSVGETPVSGEGAIYTAD